MQHNVVGIKTLLSWNAPDRVPSGFLLSKVARCRAAKFLKNKSIAGIFLYILQESLEQLFYI